MQAKIGPLHDMTHPYQIYVWFVYEKTLYSHRLTKLGQGEVSKSQ